MSVSRNESDELPHAAVSEETARLYVAVCNQLLPELTAQYGLTELEVLALIKEAFFGYLDTNDPKLDPQAWVGALVSKEAKERYGLHHAAPRPGDDPDLADQRRILVAANGLQRLGPESRRLVRLRVYEGLSYEAIAEAMDSKPAIVKGQVSRAMASLMKLQRAHRPRRPEEPDDATG